MKKRKKSRRLIQRKSKEGLFEESARIAREIWDDGDKIFMKALMEPVDEELYKELTSNEKIKKKNVSKCRKVFILLI